MTRPYWASHSFVYHSSLCDSILYDGRVPFCAADLARPVLAFFCCGRFLALSLCRTWDPTCVADGERFSVFRWA